MALALQVGFLKMTGTTLNSVERIPADILAHLGVQLDCEPPRIATIRAFYGRRRRTLFEHQATTLRLLGRGELTPHAERGLVAYMRREVMAVFDHADLMASVRLWLTEHHYLMLRERDVRDSVRQCGGNYGVVEVAIGHSAAVAIWVGTALIVGGVSSAIASVCM